MALLDDRPTPALLAFQARKRAQTVSTVGLPDTIVCDCLDSRRLANGVKKFVWDGLQRYLLCQGCLLDRDRNARTSVHTPVSHVEDVERQSRDRGSDAVGKGDVSDPKRRATYIRWKTR